MKDEGCNLNLLVGLKRGGVVRDFRKVCRLSLIGGLLGVGLLIVMGSTAFAESAWFTCSVDLAGPGKIETFVSLTDQAQEPAFVSKWFLFPPDRAREMLAVALTAINSDKKVVVVVDPDSVTYPEVTDIYLRAR